MNVDQPQAESLSIDQAADMLEGQIDSILGDEDVEPIRDDAEVDESEEVEADEVETETEEKEEESDESETEQEAEELARIESLADVAEALDQSLEDVLDNLTAKVKVQGVEESVPLRELINGYQKDADYRRKTTEFSEQRKAVEGEWQQKSQQIAEQHMILGKLMQNVERMVVGDINSEQLEQLRQTDPQAYNQARWQIKDRQEQFQKMMQEAAQGWTQGQQAMTQQQQQQFQQIVQQEREQLTQRIPDWSDEVRAGLNDYLAKSYGYGEQELGQVIDHRVVDIARKAMLYDQMKSQADVATKKVKTLPKLQKASKPQSGLSVKSSKLKTAKQRLARSGSVEDAGALLDQLGIG